jgi:hypothetical protein
MSRPQSAPKRAPEYNLVRLVTGNDGAAALRVRANGVNFGMYTKGCFQIVPLNAAAPGENLTASDFLTGATSNPVLNVRFWNDELGMYLIHSPAIAITAQGAGVAFEFDVDVYGRQVMIEVASGVTGGQSVAIFAAGHMHQEAI